MFHWRGGKRLFWKSDSPDELLVIFGLGKLGSAELIGADKAGQLTLGSSCRKSNNLLCIKPNHSQSLSPLQLLKPSQVPRDPAVSVWVFIHCCRSSSSPSLPPLGDFPQGDGACGEGKSPSSGRSVTFPYPSSSPTSAWKKCWHWDLSLWSSFDISNWSSRSALAVSHCHYSRRLQQRETHQHWTAEIGRAPATVPTLEIDFFIFKS